MDWRKLKWPAIGSLVATAGSWTLRGALEEWVFSSLTSELEAHAWIAGDFLAWGWSPLALGIAIFGGVLLAATLAEKRTGEGQKASGASTQREKRAPSPESETVTVRVPPVSPIPQGIAVDDEPPLAIEKDGIRWVHIGDHPDGAPRIRAECPEHEVPLLYKPSSLQAGLRARPARVIKDDDLLLSPLTGGDLVCSSDSGHVLDLRAVSGVYAIPYKELREAAETVMAVRMPPRSEASLNGDGHRATLRLRPGFMRNQFLNLGGSEVPLAVRIDGHLVRGDSLPMVLGAGTGSICIEGFQKGGMMYGYSTNSETVVDVEAVYD